VDYIDLFKFFRQEPKQLLRRARLKGHAEDGHAKALLSRAIETFAFRSNRISRFLRILPLQLEIVYQFPSEISKRFIINYQHLYEQQVAREGAGHVLKRLKQISGTIIRHCAGHRVEHLPFVRTKEGLPRLAHKLSPYIREGNLNERRACICLSSIYKLFLFRGSTPSTASITEAPDVTLEQYGSDVTPGRYFQLVNEKKKIFNCQELEVLVQEFRSSLDSLMSEFGDSRHRDRCLQEEADDVHLSTKKGPNGPSIGSIPFDAICWRDPEKGAAKESLLWIAKYIFNPENPLSDKVKKAYKTFLNLLNEDVKPVKVLKDGTEFRPGPTDFYLGAIREKIEAGGKIRLFAVIDWFTQTALKPLHKYIMKCLSMLPQDSTIDHNLAADQLWVWLKIGVCEIFSIDLTTATDTIPILSQSEVLAPLLGRNGGQFAHHWVRLLSQRDFSYNKETYRYGRGQPMGAYSSWAMLALWHHAIMRTCFNIVNRQRRETSQEEYTMYYLIIGDDIVCAYREVYDLYLKIVRDLLGVRISPLKGYTPDTEKSDSSLKALGYSIAAGEIAKRVFTADGEITPVPPDIWMDGCETPQGFSLLVNEIQRRGGVISWEETTNLAKFTYQSKWSLLACSFPWSSAAFACGWNLTEPPSSHGTLWEPLLWDYGENLFCKSYVAFMMRKYASYLGKYLDTKSTSLKSLRVPALSLKEFEVKGFKFRSLYLENFLLELYMTPHRSKLYSDQLFQLQQILADFNPDGLPELQLPQDTDLSVVNILNQLWSSQYNETYNIGQVFENLISDSYSLQDLLEGKVPGEDNVRIVLSKFYYNVYRSFYEELISEYGMVEH